jgi:DNA-binding response OmpR family regulator
MHNSDDEAMAQMTDSPARLLLVDDDAELAKMLHEFLELQGFSVAVVGSGEDTLQSIAESLPDMIILDVMLPGINGFEVLGKLRANHDVPVIMLTARGDEPDRIHGLMHGADDYLTKPFSPLELAARVNNVLKRSRGSGAASEAQLITGPLQLNVARRELTVNDEPVKLTAAELRVLEQLMRHPGDVISRARLTELALKRPIEAYDRSIDTLVSKLRRKLAAAGVGKECIRGLRGHGYALDSDVLGGD